MARRVGGHQLLPRPTQWRDLGPAPWWQRDTSSLREISAIRAALSQYQPDPSLQQAPSSARASAVLVALADTSNGPQVVLTRRSAALSSHQSQVAFPGGRLERGETSLQAALRETREEIGVDATTAKWLGELSAHRTVSSSSHIIPHVVELPTLPSHFVTNSEVDRVFSVALSELVREDTFAHEHWTFADREVAVPIFYLDDETIWGATARMLQELIVLTLNQ